jgi:acyl dehydratase
MAVSKPNTSSYFYEDLTPGLDFDLGKVVVDRSLITDFATLTGDGHPLHTDSNYAVSAGFSGQLVHGALMASLVIGRLVESGIICESVVAMTDLNWRFARPVTAGQTVTVRMEITNRHLLASGEKGVVGRRFLVSDFDGELLQEGLSNVVVLTRSVEGAQQLEATRPSFGSDGWVNLLAQSLEKDETFATATSSFDGSIVFNFGETSLGLRIYRGRVIDSGRAVVSSATFAISAPFAVWLKFAKRPRNEFISFAMADQFKVRGSTYDYLRMTRALMVITDHVRGLLFDAQGTANA